MKKTMMLCIATIMCGLFLMGCMKEQNQNEDPLIVETEEVTTEMVETTEVNTENETSDDIATDVVTATTSEPIVALQTDSGSYVGQADSNFIEITISGVPIEKASKVFMLSPEIKENFDSYALETDDQIQFDYSENEDGQFIIYGIRKI